MRAFLIWILSAVVAVAASVTLAWDGITDSSIVAVRIYDKQGEAYVLKAELPADYIWVELIDEEIGVRNYVARGVTASGLETLDSNMVITPNGTPTPPQLKVSGQTVVYWPYNPLAQQVTAYNVYQRLSDGTFSSISSSPLNKVEFTGFPSGHYTFGVTAKNLWGESAMSLINIKVNGGRK